MRVEELKLKNFRNIAELSISPGPAFNLLVGRNAQGKTNVIESICLISTGSSFRASDFRDMIMRGKQRAEVQAKAAGEAGADKLSVTMDDRRKSFLKNDKRAIASRASRICTVLFAPEEIMLLKEGPASRRKYMDVLISQVCPPHRTNVGKYEKVVRQRNRLLGDPEISTAKKKSGLRPWDDQLIDLGARITWERDRWCVRLNEFIPSSYGEMAPEEGDACFEYAPYCGQEAVSGGPGELRAELARQVELRRDDELLRGFTVVGPHRDDFTARIGKGEVRHYGSQGQHRSFVLAMKMAETSLFRDVTGEEPILLLDDVASELDSGRNRFFFEGLRRARGQVFITATKDRDVHLGKSSDVAVFDVEAGKAATRK
jgi:DNA replication and repair protein RecF